MPTQFRNVVPPSTPSQSSDFEWKVNPATGGVTIVKFLNCNATVCVVPAKIDGRPVVTIGNKAFFRSTLHSVALPAGLQKIGRAAFAESFALRSVTFPGSLKKNRAAGVPALFAFKVGHLSQKFEKNRRSRVSRLPLLAFGDLFFQGP